MRSSQRSLIRLQLQLKRDGVLYTETNEIARALNTHFSRIGTKLAAKIKEKLRLTASNSRKFSHLPFRDRTAIINRFPFAVSQNPLFSSN